MALPTDSKKAKGAQSQMFVPVNEIRNGTIVAEDGSLSTVLLVTSLNFALKSYDEQMAVMSQFRNFLNSLEFPIQISVQSRRLDIRPYMNILEETRREEQNDLIKMQIGEYGEFIQKFTDTVNIMEKKFFVVISFLPASIKSAQEGVGGIASLFGGGSGSKLMKDEDFEEAKSQLEQRTDLVAAGISRTGLKMVRLGTEEIIEVLYKIFNPGESEKPMVMGK